MQHAAVLVQAQETGPWRCEFRRYLRFANPPRGPVLAQLQVVVGIILQNQDIVLLANLQYLLAGVVWMWGG